MSTARAHAEPLHGYRIINETHHQEGIHKCQYPGCKQKNLKRIVHVENAEGVNLHIGVECAKKLMGDGGYCAERARYEARRHGEAVRQMRIDATLANIAMWEDLRPGTMPSGVVSVTRKGHLLIESPCGIFLMGDNYRGVWVKRAGSDTDFLNFAKGDVGYEQAGAAITSEVVSYLKQSLSSDSAQGTVQK